MLFSDIYLLGIQQYEQKMLFEPLMGCMMNPVTKEVSVIRELKLTVSLVVNC